MSWHLAETRDQAIQESALGLQRWHNDYNVKVLGRPGAEPMPDAYEAAEAIANGDPTSGAGAGIIGTPDDAIERIRALRDIVGGFGVVLGFAHDWANREATLRSWELFARYVVPEINGYLRPMRDSADYVTHEQGRADGRRGRGDHGSDRQAQGCDRSGGRDRSARRERRTALARALSITQLTLSREVNRSAIPRPGAEIAWRCGPVPSDPCVGPPSRAAGGCERGGMSDQDRNGLRALIGRLVHVDLSDGARLRRHAAQRQPPHDLDGRRRRRLVHPARRRGGVHGVAALTDIARGRDAPDCSSPTDGRPARARRRRHLRHGRLLRRPRRTPSARALGRVPVARARRSARRRDRRLGSQRTPDAPRHRHRDRRRHRRDGRRSPSSTEGSRLGRMGMVAPDHRRGLRDRARRLGPHVRRTTLGARARRRRARRRLGRADLVRSGRLAARAGDPEPRAAVPRTRRGARVRRLLRPVLECRRTLGHVAAARVSLDLREPARARRSPSSLAPDATLRRAKPSHSSPAPGCSMPRRTASSWPRPAPACSRSSAPSARSTRRARCCSRGACSTSASIARRSSVSPSRPWASC